MNVKFNDKSMKHFRKWSEGKNPFLAVSALNIAGFSKECFVLFESVNKGKRIEGDIPLPRLKNWLKMYHNHKRIGRVLLNALGEINDDSAKEVDFLKLLSEGSRQIKKMTSERFNKEWGKIPLHDRKKIIEEIYRKRDEYIEYCINDFASDTNEDERKEFLKNLIKPEFIFFIRVFATCFILHGMYPLELLRQAQNGNNDALKKLIRLDKSIIFEPNISEIIHQAQALKKQGRMSDIKMAFRNSPKVKIKMKSIKCHLGGLISYLSEAMKQKISAADIRGLYDAIALDMHGDVDQDFGDMTEETFSKNIQNARKMWQIILPE
ncbi:MAG: hypothetical protein WCO53_12055 [Deltaproteobacteria bacterium]